jgi:hypothetical protein
VAEAKLLWRQRFDEDIAYATDPAFSPDGKVLVAGVGYAEPARLFDAATGRELGRFEATEKRIRFKSAGGLAYTPDGRSLLCAYRMEDFVHVWDASTRTLTSSMTWQREAKPADKKLARPGSFSLAVSPDGKTLAAAGLDGRLRLFEVATGGLRRVVGSGECDRISVRVAFCTDGRLVRSDVPKRGHIDVSDWRRAADKAGRLSERELKRAWADLGSKDAEAGFRAMSLLLAAPEPQGLALLAGVPRAEPLTDKQIARLIADLDDEELDVREKATEDLKYAGARAEKALLAALAKPPSLEVKKRATAILKHLTPLRPERLRFLRTVEVLEAIATPEATKQLERLADGARGDELTEDAKAALARVRHLQKQRQ